MKSLNYTLSRALCQDRVWEKRSAAGGGTGELSLIGCRSGKKKTVSVSDTGQNNNLPPPEVGLPGAVPIIFVYYLLYVTISPVSVWDRSLPEVSKVYLNTRHLPMIVKELVKGE